MINKVNKITIVINFINFILNSLAFLLILFIITKIITNIAQLDKLPENQLLAIVYNKLDIRLLILLLINRALRLSRRQRVADPNYIVGLTILLLFTSFSFFILNMILICTIQLYNLIFYKVISLYIIKCFSSIKDSIIIFSLN